jgi:hypothetical protein
MLELPHKCETETANSIPEPHAVDVESGRQPREGMRIAFDRRPDRRPVVES